MKFRQLAVLAIKKRGKSEEYFRTEKWENVLKLILGVLVDNAKIY